jgi:hypothetical protein
MHAILKKQIEMEEYLFYDMLFTYWFLNGRRRQAFVEFKWNIRTQRISYVKRIREHRNEGHPTLRINENRTHGAHITPFGWSDDTLHSLLAPFSKGQRLITVHVGGEQGFVPNAYIRFKSQQIKARRLSE